MASLWRRLAATLRPQSIASHGAPVEIPRPARQANISLKDSNARKASREQKAEAKAGGKLPHQQRRTPRSTPTQSALRNPISYQSGTLPTLQGTYPAIASSLWDPEDLEMAAVKELREPDLHVRVLTTPTVDTRGTCVVLEFESDRYLIGNIHEGLSRVLEQNPINQYRVSDIIATGKIDWKHQGGLVGIMLGLAEARGNRARDPNIKGEKKGSPSSLHVHGGPNLTYTLATTRKFILRKDCHVDVHEIAADTPGESLRVPTWSDDNVQVWALPINPGRGSEDATEMPSAASSPTSRKRSFDDYLDSREGSISAALDGEGFLSETGSSEKGRLKELKSVVEQMFNSDWRIDALVEKPLSEVDSSTVAFVKNPTTKDFERYTGPRPGTGASVPSINVWVRKPWPGALVTELPKTTVSATAMSYIIKDWPRRGKFDQGRLEAMKMVSSKIRMNREVSKLVKGQSAVNLEGQTVLPEQVLGDPLPAVGFAFVDLPSIDYVSNLASRPEWQDAEVMDGVNAIIWNLGPGVTQSEELQKFIQGLANLEHVVSSPDHCANSLVFQDASSMTISQYRIDPDRYGVPVHSNATPPLPPGLSFCERAISRLHINLRKSPRIDSSHAHWPLNTAKVLRNVRSAARDAAARVKKDLLSPAAQKELDDQDLPNADSEIITLGTGSAAPSKYRNVSGTLVRIPGVGSYLLDCGENTLGQLGRVYSAPELADVLRDLRMIWISHMHADHHLGLVSVIKAWHEVVYGKCEDQENAPPANSSSKEFDPVTETNQGQRLIIASEPTIMTWLNEYASVENYGRQKLIFVETNAVRRNRDWKTQVKWNGTAFDLNTEDAGTQEAIQKITGFAKLEVAKVPHCSGSHAISLTFPSGFKLSYSGDCRPSKQFVDIGKDSTVLIHEATFGGDKAGHAIAKKHSTIPEAIGVGLAMRARRLVLTHFSNRYSEPVDFDLQSYKPPPLEEASAVQDLEPVGASAEGRGDDESRSTRPGFFDRSYSQEPEEGEFKTDMKLAIANDFMRVKVKDIIYVERFSPVMAGLYHTRAKDRIRTPTPSPERPGRDDAEKIRQDEALRARIAQISQAVEEPKLASAG